MAFINEEKTTDYYISSWRHTSQVSDLLKSCSVEEFETILKLSYESLKSLRESSSSLQFQEILNKKLFEKEKQKQNEIDQLYSQLESKRNLETSRLHAQIKELQLQLEQTNVSYQLMVVK